VRKIPLQNGKYKNMTQKLIKNFWELFNDETEDLISTGTLGRAELRSCLLNA
jgi:hypothetical protein